MRIPVPPEPLPARDNLHAAAEAAFFLPFDAASYKFRPRPVERQHQIVVNKVM
jgi:hypothetical protein